MTPDTKDTRRMLWKSHNFAGTIDWAVDLQSFTSIDANDFADRPTSGEGCVSGSDTTLDSVDLCEFTCELGFCPEPLCACDETGELEPLPDESDRNISNIIAFDERNVDLNRVCKFACKYGYCPEKLCFDKPKENEPAAEDDPNPRDDIVKECFIYQAPSEGRNDHRCQLLCNNPDTRAGQPPRGYGCIGKFGIDEEIPWFKGPRGAMVAAGECTCDIEIINIFADIVIEALPAIAQVCPQPRREQRPRR